MARSAEPGRTTLLDAGIRILTTTGLGDLSVNTVVATAGTAKGAFYQHWPSRTSYPRDLHPRLHNHLPT
jgi:TetR/AcrR family transcriptional repressor of nem operon